MSSWAAGGRGALAATLVLAAAVCAQFVADGRGRERTDQRSGVGGAMPYSIGRALPDRAAAWTRAREIRVITPPDLWTHIDGAAEQYLAYGFQDLAASRYTDGAGSTVAADIYRMIDAVHAFGIYRQELSPAARAVPIGVEGRAGANSLKFWTGGFYVKLTAFARSGRGVDLAPLGAAIASGLGVSGALPMQVRWFPPAGLQPDSVRFLPVNALGQAAFAHAFEAKYENPGNPATLVIVPFESREGAEAALAKYEASLARASGHARVAAPGEGGFSATDPFEGFILAVRDRSTIVVLLGAADKRRASSLVSETVTRLLRQ